MNSVKERLKRFHLALLFALIVCLIMFGSSIVIFFFGFMLYKMGFNVVDYNHRISLLVFALISLVIGTFFAFLFSNKALKPLLEIMKATDLIAEGDYSARLDLKGPNELKQLSDSFNNMAEELGSVELLRTDFVNNFSHEFKTPIVSIRGFARILKRPDLTLEVRSEYLDIIISESERLAELADQVLSLSKLENQVIITDKNEYNVSEQIRLIIAMMHSKWSERNIEIDFDRGEMMLYANEELMKQVFINLLDNAVKFSPDDSSVKVIIQEKVHSLVFLIRDQGKGIDKETASHIFEKFYQGDTSHAVSGNGLGMTIAKRIVTLHGGTIRVSSSIGKGTTIEVELPIASLEASKAVTNSTP